MITESNDVNEVTFNFHEPSVCIQEVCLYSSSVHSKWSSVHLLTQKLGFISCIVGFWAGASTDKRQITLCDLIQWDFMTGCFTVAIYLLVQAVLNWVNMCLQVNQCSQVLVYYNPFYQQVLPPQGSYRLFASKYFIYGMYNVMHYHQIMHAPNTDQTHVGDMFVTRPNIATRSKYHLTKAQQRAPTTM